MNKKEAFDIIVNSMKEDKSIIVYKDLLPKDVRDRLCFNIQSSQREETGASFDLSYEIMRDALQAIEGAGINDLNLDHNDNEFASVYTAEQLSWLNINNQGDITDLVKEYDCDIATACATWYDTAVLSTIGQVIEYINEFED
jgi:hypothetical protein